jgi:peptidylprolyl isomerase
VDVFLPLRLLAVLTAAPSLALALTACGGGSSSAVSGPAGSKMTKVGVAVTGGFGEKPTLTVPKTAAPKELTSEVLNPGNGAAVGKGQTLIANYLGETWDLKDGKPNVFDNSYDRKQVSGFQIGTGTVISGWDKTLVGKKLGSRVLLTIPPEEGYDGSKGQTNELTGKTLLFVVDLVAAIDANTAATGTPVTKLPDGMPAVSSESGSKPVITSVKGVKPGAKPVSTLLISGTGDQIDPEKSLVLEVIQTDAATGRNTQETWGSALQVIPAAQVVSVLSALKSARVGSRAVGIVPADSAGSAGGTQTPASVVVVDVVGQY